MEHYYRTIVPLFLGSTDKMSYTKVVIIAFLAGGLAAALVIELKGKPFTEPVINRDLKGDYNDKRLQERI